MLQWTLRQEAGSSQQLLSLGTREQVLQQRTLQQEAASSQRQSTAQPAQRRQHCTRERRGGLPHTHTSLAGILPGSPVEKP
jgi:hypothetical protein